MCLALPVKVVAVHGDGLEATATIEGTGREVNLAMVAGVRPGDYVLVHAGLAVRRLDAAEAEAVLAEFGG